MPLEPDRDQLEIFVNAVFRYAASGAVSLRSFFENCNKPFQIVPMEINGNGLIGLIDIAERMAGQAANAAEPVVFCPPLATFNNGRRATKSDVAEGLVLSVECDSAPQGAREKLEQVLGPATVVVRSGGQWIDPKTGEQHDKLHLHWRLAEPATGKTELAGLEGARARAARVAGGDPSNAPVVHPIRWPGSWHRKGKPRLCEIETADPDREIVLEWAIEALGETVPEAGQANRGDDQDHQRTEWEDAFRLILTGESYHPTLAPLAASFANWGAPEPVTDNVLRSLLINSNPTDSARQRRRDAELVKLPQTVASAYEKFGAKAEEIKPKLIPLHAYIARPFAQIPRRQWLHAGHYIRKHVVMTVAPGGFGKTTLILCNAIEMATGTGLIGSSPSGTLRCAYWNAEDEQEEIERRIAAICLRYKLNQAALSAGLFLGSKITGKERLAKLDRHGNVVLNKHLLTQVTQFVGDNRVDCVIFDPLIAFHRVPESNNTAMEQVVKEAFEPIAVTSNCCVELSQHTRKPSQGQHGEITADDSRGGGAIVFAARSVRVLNRMSKEDAEIPQISDEDRRRYLRISRDKTNLVPPAKATWIRLASVDLPNSSDELPGDNVQVAETWDYPQPFDNVTADDMRWMRDTVRAGNYRVDPRSPDWVGLPLIEHLGLDPDTAGSRKRAAAILRAWFQNRVLATETRKDGIRHNRKFVIPGSWNEEE
jgi:hypothetical protein